jgi:protein-S-isoprenylcysteine O-methyltransferase Ste14
MSTSIIVLRVISVLAFLWPMLMVVGGRRAVPASRPRPSGGERAPLLSNLAAVGLYLPSLLAFSGRPTGSMALLLASSGLLVAVVGVTLVLRSRAELGSAWSLLPNADQDIGLVTTGPYRGVRHPIYLGLVLLATGEALAFHSLPAFVITLFGIFPTFVWRAHAEEKLLRHAFGERYEVYRRRTRMIIPRLF